MSKTHFIYRYANERLVNVIESVLQNLATLKSKGGWLATVLSVTLFWNFGDSNQPIPSIVLTFLFISTRFKNKKHHELSQPSFPPT